MKSHALPSKSATLEDIVFEGRNKLYGAYALNKNHRKYLLVSFFIALTGISTVIAVPFLHAMNHGNFGFSVDQGISVTLIDPSEADPFIPPPPPPPPMPVGDEQIKYLPPEVVEEPTEAEFGLLSMGELADIDMNTPPPVIDLVVVSTGKEIEEPPSEPIWFPEEAASFNNGNLSEFQKWVQLNVNYPPLAVENHVFGKVILQFCVNTMGEVTDIKVIRSVDPLLDNESKRVISASPIWKPARQGGRPVKQLFTIPVMFQLQN